MTKREKVYLAATVALILFLLVKSFVLDPVRPGNETEEAALLNIEKAMDEKFVGGLYDYKILVNRVVKLEPLKEDDSMLKAFIKNNNIETFDVEGKYKAKIRKYFLGILPVGEEKIINVEKE